LSRGWELHDWQPPTGGPWESFAAVGAADLATYTDVGIAVREASSSDVNVIHRGRRFTVPAGTITQRVYFIEDGCLTFVQLARPLPPPPPPASDPCLVLRASNQELLNQLGRLNQELKALDPHIDDLERREIQAEINDVNTERDRLRERLHQLGCLPCRRGSTGNINTWHVAHGGNMSFVFKDFLDIAPIPVSPMQAAHQSVAIAKKIEEAGGAAAGRAAAVAVILNAITADKLTEIRRLRLLYQRAYSEAELNRLVERTFESLGLVD
jgi:hypothetical protein